MAKVTNHVGQRVSGKYNKKTNEVHRVRNDKEHVYELTPYTGPASKAQKLNRSIFGKANAIVNGILADPTQVPLWEKRMEQHNRISNRKNTTNPKRFLTLRQYVYHVISQQLTDKPSVRRRLAELPPSLPRGVKLHVASFAELTTAELYEILRTRFSVFVCEQHIHYLDEDGIDFAATHFALRRRGRVIAYARVFPDTEQPGTLRIGRMLTVERGKGFGRYLLSAIISHARSQGATLLRLHAQTHAVPFYEHLGFATVGDIFFEAELPHIMMQLPL